MHHGTLIIVVAVLSAIGLMAITLYLYRLSRGTFTQRAIAKKEESLKAKVREKAKSAKFDESGDINDLTDSGGFSVL